MVQSTRSSLEERSRVQVYGSSLGAFSIRVNGRAESYIRYIKPVKTAIQPDYHGRSTPVGSSGERRLQVVRVLITHLRGRPERLHVNGEPVRQ